jgi:hypothetical protein
MVSTTMREGTKTSETKNATTTATTATTVEETKEGKMTAMTLKGFIVSIHCPSEELLTIALDCSSLPPSRYMQLVVDLQDLLTEIDERYAVREVKGRSLRARYRRVSADQRQRILKFSPFPSCIINKVKYVRTKAYEVLHDHCLVISSVESQYRRDNIYVLPKDMAEEFVKAVEELDGELDGARRMVKEFDLADVELLLSRYGLELPKRDFSIPNIRIDLLPIDLTYAIEEWGERSPRVRQLLVERQEELVRKAVESISKRLEPVLKAMEGELKLRDLEERLEEIRKLAEDLGLKALAETVVKPLMTAVKDPRVLGERPTDFVRGRIASLFPTRERW